MSVTIHCPGCDKQYVIGPELLGKAVKCAACGRKFTAARPREPEAILAELVDEPPTFPAEPTISTGSPFAPVGAPSFDTPMEPDEPPPARGWLMTHKLLVAALAVVALAGVVAVLIGHFVMAGGLAVAALVVVPFGLRPTPGWKESKSWIPFLLVAAGVLAILGHASFQAIKAEATAPDDAAIFLAMGSVVFVFIAGLIFTEAALMRLFGFFRPAAWALCVVALGYACIAAPVTLAIRTAKASKEEEKLQNQIASARSRVAQTCGGERRVVTVEVSDVPDDARECVNHRVMSEASKLPGYSVEIVAKRIYVVGPIDDVGAFVASLDLGEAEIDAAARRIDIVFDPRHRPDPPPPEIEDPANPRFFERNLADLASWDKERRDRAMTRLADCSPDEAQRRKIVAAVAPLLDDADVAIRQRAASVYSRHFGEEEIPRLAEMLADRDQTIQVATANGLAATKDPRAVDLLLQGSTRNLSIRANALKTMGPIAEDPVLARLERDKTAGTGQYDRGSYYAILGEVGTEKSVPLLLKSSKAGGTNSPSRQAATAARKIHERQLKASGSYDEITMLLYDLQLDSDHFEQACVKLKLMSPAKFPDRKEEVINTLLAAMVQNSNTEKATAAFLVWKSPKDIPVIIEQFEQADNGASSLVSLLAALEDERATRAMVERLITTIIDFPGSTHRHYSPEVGGGGVVRSLEIHERFFVMHLEDTLRRMGPKAEGTLLEALAETDEGLRAEILCGLLRETGTERCLPRLRVLEESPDAIVRYMARTAADNVERRTLGGN